MKGNPWKASLHADASWRVAVTSEHERSGKPPVVPGGRTACWEFQPTEFENGGRLAFVVAAFRNALMDQPPDPKETVVEVADQWDRLTTLRVWMTEPSVELSGSPILGGPLTLSSGRRVWVTARDERITASDPEPPPVSAFVKPVNPEEHGVTAPGFLIHGLKIVGSGEH
jgi:hypothetical protein